MVLDLDQLNTGVMGLTPEFGSFCLQACTVCLDNSKHVNGVTAPLTGVSPNSITLNWSSLVTAQIKRNWADMQETLEYGATAIAILLASKITTYTCIERSSKGTGFDYWLGNENSLGIFQQKARLEISGILSESATNTLDSRIKTKITQTQKSAALKLDAHICVTEFSNPKCEYQVV